MHDDDRDPVTRFDVMLCVGPGDVDGLFATSLRLLLANFRPLGQIHVVTPAVAAVREVLARIPDERAARVRVRADEEVCPEAAALPPWFRQQYVKLHADRLSDERFVVCLGADTLILDPVDVGDLLADDGRPVLRYFRHLPFNPHVAFERARVTNVARLLDVEPVGSRPAGDFICDLFVFERETLQALRARVGRRKDLLQVLLDLGPRQGAENRFGEWTLYAVFCIDVLQGAGVRVEPSRPSFFGQIHGRLDARRPGRYRSRVVHFATEPGGTDAVLADLARHGRLAALTR